MSANTYMKVFSDNLRNIMQLHDKKQSDLVRDLGFTKSTVSAWCNATRAPRMDKVEAIARYFGIQKSDLIESPTEEFKQSKVSALRIPVFKALPTNVSISSIEAVDCWEVISASLAQPGKEFFGLIVSDDSMSPKYLEGDCIIAETAEDCESGTDCIVYADGNEATLKRIIKSDSEIIVQCLNPAYEPIVYRLDSNQDNHPIRIAGRVIEIRRKV